MGSAKIEKPRDSILYKLFLMFFPLIFLCITFIDIVSKFNARSWVEGHATVLSKDVYQRDSGGHPWCEKITYRYSIDGRFYEGCKLSSSTFSDIGCNRNQIKIEERINSIPLGAVISIYYDKNFPSNYAIEIDGFHFFDFAYMVVACLVISAASVYIINSISKRKSFT